MKRMTKELKNSFCNRFIKMLRWEKSIALSAKKFKELKKLKISYIRYETLALSSICNDCGSEDEKIYTEEASIEMLKILGLINNIDEYQKAHGWRKHKSRN